MKLKLLSLKVFSLVLVTGLMFTSCKKDSDPVDDIVGSWLWQGATFDIMIGNQTLTQYLVEEGGYTVTEAEQLAGIYEQGLEDDFSGTIQVRDDQTYTSNFGGESDSGTWSLSSDRKKLTIDSGTEGSFVFDVAELTSSAMKLQATDTYSDDFNGDEVQETMSIDMELSYTK
jgi:hypothetical protein